MRHYTGYFFPYFINTDNNVKETSMFKTVRKDDSGYITQLKHQKSTSLSVLLCRSSYLLLGGNVRWPRRMLPLVSHVEYADGTDRRTDGRTNARPLHYAFRHTRLSRSRPPVPYVANFFLFFCFCAVPKIKLAISSDLSARLSTHIVSYRIVSLSVCVFTRTTVGVRDCFVCSVTGP